jgi:hypothetical protein
MLITQLLKILLKQFAINCLLILINLESKHLVKNSKSTETKPKKRPNVQILLTIYCNAIIKINSFLYPVLTDLREI